MQKIVDFRNRSYLRLDFKTEEFENFVTQNGLRFELQRAMFCPCRLEKDNSPLQDCESCKGTGWLFSEPSNIFGMVSSLSENQRIGLTADSLVGTSNLTLSEKYDFRLDYFDKLSLIDSKGILRKNTIRFDLKENDFGEQVFVAQCPFDISSIEKLIVLSEKSVLYVLGEGDFTFKDNLVTLSDLVKYEFLDRNKTVVRGSIRYYVRPIYHVLNINHIVRSTNVLAGGKETPIAMPLQYTIREAIYFNKYGEPISF